MRDVADLRAKSVADDAIIAELRALLGATAAQLDALQELRHHMPTSFLRARQLQLGPPLTMGTAALPAQRTLLQESPGDESGGRNCALQDILDILGSLAEMNTIAVVMRMMETNTPCALCVVPCSGPFENAFLGPLACLYGCMHQDENQCPATMALDPLIANATLDDRDMLIHLMETAEVDTSLWDLRWVQRML
jgi:hypothetical protein